MCLQEATVPLRQHPRVYFSTKIAREVFDSLESWGRFLYALRACVSKISEAPVIHTESSAQRLTHGPLFTSQQN